MAACPTCLHPHVVKAGKARGKHRWRCRGCGDQVTSTTPRGKLPWQKSLAILLDCHGDSMNALAKMFGVWTSTILPWIRRDAADHAEKPAPSGKATVLDIDEWKAMIVSTAMVDLSMARFARCRVNGDVAEICTLAMTPETILSWRLYRMPKDLYWNCTRCRNAMT